MTNQQLLEAMGYLEEGYLTRSETEKHPQKRRMNWAAVAAVVAGLILTACSASYLIASIAGGRIEVSALGRVEYDADGNLVGYNSAAYYIYLDVDLGEDAGPIETYYVPKALDEWVQTFGMRSGDTHIVMVWQNPDDITQWAEFNQMSGEQAAARIRKGIPIDVIGAPHGYAPTSKVAELGGGSVLLVELAPCSDGIYSDEGERRIYWTNGTDVFYINCAYETTDEMLEQWVRSLRGVKNIETYLTR